MKKSKKRTQVINKSFKNNAIKLGEIKGGTGGTSIIVVIDDTQY